MNSLVSSAPSHTWGSSSGASGLPKTTVRYEGEGEAPPHTHCPLCVASMIDPKELEKPLFFMFLDMDGVMSDRLSNSKTETKIKETVYKIFPNAGNRPNHYQWTLAKGRCLNTHSVEKISDLIRLIEDLNLQPLIVLSTAWRNDATLEQHIKEAFSEVGFGQYICGKTAPEDWEFSYTPEYKQGFRFEEGADKFDIKLNNRAQTIRYWLKDHGFSPEKTHFAILDDCDDKLSKTFGERFIPINSFPLKLSHVTQVMKQTIRI